MANQKNNQTAQVSEVSIDTKEVLNYQDKKIVLKQAPIKGQNVAVYVRPGDNVAYEMENIDIESLDYRLVGGDIVVTMPNGGVFTFVSMALMGYSENPPSFLGVGGQKYSLGDILSQVEEINDLPFDSIAVEANIQQEDRVKKIIEEYEQTVQKLSQVVEQRENLNNLLSNTQTQKFAFEDTSSKIDNFMFQESRSTVQESNAPSQLVDQFLGRYTQAPRPKNDFNDYKPDVEMIPKPDVEMIPKPDEEMMPVNDFDDYNPYEEDGSGNGTGDYLGDGEVVEAAKPAFYFKATAQQIKYSEAVNEYGQVEVLGGGGSVNGYKFDSITNQFESEVIDMSDRSEDMVVRAENSTYFSNIPASQTGIQALTFQDLAAGQSVSVDGLTLTATDAIAAADVAAAFANLAANAVAGNAVVNGTWSGTALVGWTSGAATDAEVTFTSTVDNENIGSLSVTSSGSTINPPTDVSDISIQGDGTTTEAHALTFQDLVAGQSVTVDGLTLTATDAIAAADVAAAFANLAANAAAGNAVANGTWSGNLSAAWASGAAADAEVTFTSQTPNTDVTDIIVSSAGSTIAEPTEVGIVAEEQIVTTYLSRVLRFEPQMPEGFYVDNFELSGLPSGVTLFDKEGNAIVGSSITKDQMIFKDALGNIIEYGSPDFLTNFKSAEFVIKYSETVPETFDVSIASNYKLDDAYLETTDIEPEQSFVNDYTFALRDITSADDYTYNKLDFANAKEEGFILPKETNSNIIKDGSGNSTIYGGIVKDTVYDGAGDDTIYLSKGDDVLYGGSGTNYVHGDAAEADGEKYAGVDTVSYESVKSFATSEVKLLEQQGLISAEENQKLTGTYIQTDVDGNPIANSLDIDMLASYKGVYVDLDGVHVDGLNIDVDGDGDIDSDDKINTISKFADRTDRFSYDENGNAVDTTISKSITFTSTDTRTAVDDLVVSSDISVDSIATQGSEIVTEKHTVVFKDLADGENITIGGLTLSATGAIAATDVAAAFANLNAGATQGNAVANGAWSGELSSAWSSGAQDQSGLENLQAIGYDILEDIENVTGSSYNDTIYGNALKDNVLLGLGGSDTLDGRGGNNRLFGGDGYDTLLSGSGEDYIDGGGDTDTVSYENATEGITIRFDRPNEETFDYAGRDDGNGNFVIKDTILNVEDIRGSAYADTIYGNGSTNYIEGGGGDDLILAGGGYDFIDGGAGSDKITYNPADYPDIATNPNFMDEIQGITVDLNSSDFVMVKETATNRLIDLVKSVEQIRATDGNDVIYGNNSSAETFWGLDGNDTLYGRDGNDTLYGGDGNDTIRPGAGLDISYGGEGTDYLELYDDGVAAVNGTRTLKLTEDGTVQHSTDGGTTWVDGYSANGGINLAYEFEGFGASNSADTMYGNSQDNVLRAHNGNDTIYAGGGNDAIRGGEGADTLYGEDGNDTIYGDQNDDIIYAGAGDDIVYGYGKYDTSSNNDTIDGGEGTNTLNYNGTNNGFVLNMASVDGGGYATVDMSTGAIYDDKVKNFTKIIGSTGADTITANDSGMYLDGGNGTDKLYGGTGDDTIIARNTSGEILDGGDGEDTLQLVQNVDFRNKTVTDFEVLNMQTYNAYFNLSQLSQFQTVQGSGNFYLYGTNSNDMLDFSVLDLRDMSGKVYIYGYNGDDEFNFNGAILGDDATFYLDAGSGIDTLKLGDNQTLEMTDNYYNTFEDFDVGEDSTLNVYALNDNGRTFYANNKDFSGVDSDNDGIVNFIGGGGNDTYYVDYTALDLEKLSVEGGGGNDIVDIRTTLTNSSLTLDDTQIFADIERVELDSILNTNSINIDADALAAWTGGEDLTLDIANNTQGTQVTITDTQVTVNDVPVEADITNITVNSSYSVTPVDDPSLSFNMAVV